MGGIPSTMVSQVLLFFYPCSNTISLMDKFLTPFLLDTGLLRGSVICPEVVALDDPEEARRMLQNALARSRARRSAPSLHEGASSRSPQFENRKPKRRSSSLTGTQGKKAKKIPSELAIVVLVDEGEASNEEASLQRRSFSAQLDAQLREL